MAKLGDFKTPTGTTGNIFNVGDWLALIVGTIVLFITFGLGQRAAQGLNGKFGLDTEVEQPWKNPMPQTPPSNQRIIL